MAQISILISNPNMTAKEKIELYSPSIQTHSLTLHRLKQQSPKHKKIVKNLVPGSEKIHKPLEKYLVEPESEEDKK